MPCHLRCTSEPLSRTKPPMVLIVEAFVSIASGSMSSPGISFGLMADGTHITPGGRWAGCTAATDADCALAAISRSPATYASVAFTTPDAAAPIRELMPWRRGPSSSVKYDWIASEIAPDCVALTAPSMAGLNPFNASPRAVAYVLTSVRTATTPDGWMLQCVIDQRDRVSRSTPQPHAPCAARPARTR